MRGGFPAPLSNKEIIMADVFYKKPSGEVFKYQAGRMKKSSCDEKYTLCDIKGKEIKKAVKKETKKAKK